MDLYILFGIVLLYFIVVSSRTIIEETFAPLTFPTLPDMKGKIKSMFVTPPPPTLEEEAVPWNGTFSMQSKDPHGHVHSPLLVNYFPMGKPPEEIETIATGEEYDLARAQFVPKMAKRTPDPRIPQIP